MRRKFSTLLDEHLYDRARLEASRQGKQIADVVGEALTEYLDERSALVGPAGVVAGSWGALRLPLERVRQILADEEGLLDGRGRQGPGGDRRRHPGTPAWGDGFRIGGPRFRARRRPPALRSHRSRIGWPAPRGLRALRRGPRKPAAPRIVYTATSAGSSSTLIQPGERVSKAL